MSAEPTSVLLPDSPIEKARTRIAGLDEITGGGLPRGRATLVSGNVGCGKTLFGVEFLVRGAEEFGEPGLLMTFEETPAELAQNVRALGFDLRLLVERKQLALRYVHVERREIEETGDYDLEGLFVQLDYAVDQLGARRVVLDTIETIFSAFSNEAILRAELRRLFRWLKEKGITAIITAEAEEGQLSRHGLEEFLSDCVIRLDRRMVDEVSTRRLAVVKYRGSAHGTNEYPFLIAPGGISILPITSVGLQHSVSEERLSSGIPRLDTMLGGEGFYRGSSVLISGTAGTGKTSIAAAAAQASCRRGERCLYFAFEESPAQLVRNMRSIGIDLEPWCAQDLLRFEAARPTLYGLETHLATIHRAVQAFAPRLVVLDPVTNFVAAGTRSQVKGMLLRLIDYLKSRGITGIFTSLTSGGALEQSETEVSSLIDTWILLKFVETNGERNRALYILKSRGMAHSNQVREFVLSGAGVELVDVYLGPAGVLTGSARYVQEAREAAEALAREQELAARRRALDRERRELERRIAALRAEHAAKEDDFRATEATEGRRAAAGQADRSALARLRREDESRGGTHPDARAGGER